MYVPDGGRGVVLLIKCESKLQKKEIIVKEEILL